jgi:hypothetical protein
MIDKFRFPDLRNAEYFQLMVSARAIFQKIDAASDYFAAICAEFETQLKLAEVNVLVARYDNVLTARKRERKKSENRQTCNY